MTGNDIAAQLRLASQAIIAQLNDKNSSQQYGFYAGFNQWAEAAEIHIFNVVGPNNTFATELFSLQQQRTTILSDITKGNLAHAVSDVNTFMSLFEKYLAKVDTTSLAADIQMVDSHYVTS